MINPTDQAERRHSLPFRETAREHVPRRLGEDPSRLTVPEPSTTNSPLHQAIFDYFWPRLPFTGILEETGPRSHDQLAHATAASLAKLGAWRQDTQRFAEAVCDCSIEYRSESDVIPAATQRAIQSRREAIISRVASLPPLPPLLTSSLMAEPLEDVCHVIGDCLRQFCCGLIDDLFRVLDSLVDAEVAGTMNRTAGTCHLYFCRQVIIPKPVETRTRVEVHRTASQIIADRFVTTTGPVEFRLARHEHHVMNLVEQPIRETTVNIPEHFQPLLAAMPSWLQPHVTIVEGRLIHERIIEKELREDTDALETTVVSRTNIEGISYDPAIVLGDYVLTGWGSREIRQEAELQQYKRVEARSRQCRRHSVSYRIGSACLILIGTALLLLSRVTPSLFLASAMLTTFLGLAAAYVSLEQYALARKEGATNSWFPFFGTTAVTALTATVHLTIAAFLYSCWLLAAALFMFIVFIAAYNFASSRHPGV